MIHAIVLTSSKRGTAAHHLPLLAECENCRISAVIYNRGEQTGRRAYYRRKLKKTLRIGPLGALNGIRMRRWYKRDVEEYLDIPPIDELCREHNIPYFETPDINCETTEDCFQKADAEVGLSLGNGYIRESVFEIPRYGMLNIHHELLPEYQKAQSVIWQLYNESATTGYTIHKINSEIDGGEIVYRERVPIRFEESLSETVTRTQADLLERSARGLVHVLENFEELYHAAEPQGEGRSYTTPSFWQFLRIYYNYRKLRSKSR